MPPIGLPSNTYDKSLVEAFRQGLRDVGIVENRDVILDVDWSSGDFGPGATGSRQCLDLRDRRVLYYRANRNDCSTCSLKPKCTTAIVRKVTRDVDEDALASTESFQQSRRERKKIEMRFAHMKRIFKLDRLPLRGSTGAKDEVLLTQRHRI